MGVLLCGVSGVRVGGGQDGLDGDHERDGLGSRQRISSNLSMQLLDPLPGQLVIVHQLKQLCAGQDKLLTRTYNDAIRLESPYGDPFISQFRECALQPVLEQFRHANIQPGT